MPPLLYLLNSTIATGFVDRKPAKRLAHLCRVASATNGLRCQPSHEAGQYLEHHQRLIYFGPCKYANVGAAIARERDNALGGQTLQRLTNRTAADADALSEVRLDEFLTRNKAPQPNARDDDIDHRIGRAQPVRTDWFTLAKFFNLRRSCIDGTSTGRQTFHSFPDRR